MGMFNTLLADVRCPTTHEVARDVHIQIKWQAHNARVLDVYRVGDALDEIDAECDNAWIQTDYICPVCSRKAGGKGSLPFIKTEDQQRHIVFVHVDHGAIREIVTESERLCSSAPRHGDSNKFCKA